MSGWSIFGKKKERLCKLCEKVLKEDNPQLKLDTADGVLVLDICEECADSLDKIRSQMVKGDG